jgi:hypothetical protein
VIVDAGLLQFSGYDQKRSQKLKLVHLAHPGHVAHLRHQVAHSRVALQEGGVRDEPAGMLGVIQKSILLGKLQKLLFGSLSVLEGRCHDRRLVEATRSGCQLLDGRLQSLEPKAVSRSSQFAHFQ